MKLGLVFFSLFMFTVLFGVPVVQSIVEDKCILVLQETDEKDAAESEDIQLEDTLEKLYYSGGYAHRLLLSIESTQLRTRSCLYSFRSQNIGVETPPPKCS